MDVNDCRSRASLFLSVGVRVCVSVAADYVRISASVFVHAPTLCAVVLKTLLYYFVLRTRRVVIISPPVWLSAPLMSVILHGA